MAFIRFHFYISNAAWFVGISGGRNDEIHSDIYFGKLLKVLIAQMTVAAILYSQGLLINLRLWEVSGKCTYRGLIISGNVSINDY